jgi:hypothetical protein
VNWGIWGEMRAVDCVFAAVAGREMRSGGLVYRRGEASADWWRGRCRGSMA